MFRSITRIVYKVPSGFGNISYKSFGTTNRALLPCTGGGPSDYEIHHENRKTISNLEESLCKSNTLLWKYSRGIGLNANDVDTQKKLLNDHRKHRIEDINELIRTTTQLISFHENAVGEYVKQLVIKNSRNGKTFWESNDIIKKHEDILNELKNELNRLKSLKESDDTLMDRKYTSKSEIFVIR
jgi:hypothetical protein